MPTTRDFTSLGEFAVNANEVEIGEGERLDDESYRNTVFTTFQQQRGKQFGVVPVSENANQQIYNESQFTNLIDFQGIPGWKFDVTYAASAIVFGSNGTLYLSKLEGNINIDPVDDEYADDWWILFEGGTEIAAKFADQTEGQEGSRLVGTTEIIPTTDELLILGDYPSRRIGTTLKDNLDSNTRLFNQMENVEILASLGNQPITIDIDFPTSNASLSTENFNVSTIDITAYSKTAPPPASGTNLKIGYLTVNFTNPIPTPYLYSLTINPDNGLANVSVGGVPTLFPDINGRPFYGVTSTSVANVTANSIDVGCLVLSRPPDSFSPEWPPDWGNENPQTRRSWGINLFCYRII